LFIEERKIVGVINYMGIELLTAIAAILSALATLAGVWAKQKFGQRGKCQVETHVKAGANVYTALQFIKSNMQCSRAYVFEFHNGGSYFSGRGQQKFSCTHEVVDPGVSAECTFSQDHRVSNYSVYINELIAKGSFSCSGIDHVEDSGFRSLLAHKGVKALYNVPIKTLNGKIIGILGVDYINEIKDFPEIEKNESVQEFMSRQARLIAGYLI
jgi:hypothetical protein